MKTLYKNLLAPSDLDPKVLSLLLRDTLGQRFYLPVDIANFIWPRQQRTREERAIHYNQARMAVRRLRFDDPHYHAPILNRGATNGPYYIPRIGEQKLAEEDLAHRQRMGAGWQHNTDILREATNQHLTVAEWIKVSA